MTSARPPDPAQTRRARLTAAAIGARLRPLYEPALREPIPSDWTALLEAAPSAVVGERQKGSR